jgi:phosphoribosyl-ATP pyrophosphohydrolase
VRHCGAKCVKIAENRELFNYRGCQIIFAGRWQRKAALGRIDAYRLRHAVAKLPQIVMSSTESIFAQLMAVIESRKAEMPEHSYTTRLFRGGVPKIGEKITEEAAEVVEAAGEPGDEGRSHLIREAGDLVYHLFVMLGHREIALSEVEAELAKRFGISGLDEKASRHK